MATRYIYLSDEINNKLKLEENASNLIVTLLTQHYEKQETPQEKLSTIQTDIDQKQKELEYTLEEIKQIEARKEEELNKMANREIPEDIIKQRWERMRLVQREAFNYWDIPTDLIETEFNEFLELLRNQKIGNMVVFMNSKGYKRKEKRSPRAL